MLRQTDKQRLVAQHKEPIPVILILLQKVLIHSRSPDVNHTCEQIPTRPHSGHGAENWKLGLKCNADVWIWWFFICDDASYLPVICGQNERQIVARADGGGQELLFVPMPDTGPLQHKSGNSLISICSQGSCVSRAHAILCKYVPRFRNVNFPRKSKLLTQRI